MPTIICDYCDYVGQGGSFEERIENVINHEKSCDWHDGICPYCNGPLRKIEGADLTYHVCDSCEEMAEPEEEETNDAIAKAKPAS